jgi:hypothetical protein
MRRRTLPLGLVNDPLTTGLSPRPVRAGRSFTLPWYEGQEQAPVGAVLLADNSGGVRIFIVSMFGPGVNSSCGPQILDVLETGQRPVCWHCAHCETSLSCRRSNTYPDFRGAFQNGPKKNFENSWHSW